MILCCSVSEPFLCEGWGKQGNVQLDLSRGRDDAGSHVESSEDEFACVLKLIMPTLRTV